MRWKNLCVMLGVLFFATTSAQAQSDEPEDGLSVVSGNEALAGQGDDRVTADKARDRAKLMHDIYAATLEVMHDRYFHADKTIIPARAMEDVFSEMQRQSKVEARWIAVSFKPMNINNEAESDFEKRAKKEIATGKSEVETIENGFYRRVGAIPLGTNCISCHAGFFRKVPTKPRFAGLVINIPIRPDPKPSTAASHPKE